MLLLPLTDDIALCHIDADCRLPDCRGSYTSTLPYYYWCLLLIQLTLLYFDVFLATFILIASLYTYMPSPSLRQPHVHVLLAIYLAS